MIKAVILDVDGILVGNKAGINFPLPNKEVIKELKRVHAKKILIILCTTKFNFAVLNLIKQANLNNPHITDNGALIIDPINNRIIKKHVIAQNIVKNIIKNFLLNNIYLEIYTAAYFYIQKTQVSDFTLKRMNILQIEMDPIIVHSLTSIAKQEEIIKIICFAKNVNDVVNIERTVNKFKNKLSFLWSFNEKIQPIKPGIITSGDASKSNAVREAVENLKLSFNDIIGIGDSASDWDFMKLCRYVGTLENGDNLVKELVKTKGGANYFIGPHVNNNGVVQVLKHFL